MKKLLWLLPLAFVVFLPQIASIPLTKPVLEKLIEKQAPVQVKFGSYHFSWLGPQVFHTIEWSHEPFTGTIEQVTIDAPFWSFSGATHLQAAAVLYQGTLLDTLNGDVNQGDFSLKGQRLALQGTKDGNVDVQIDHADLKTHIVGRVQEGSFLLEKPLLASFFLKEGPIRSVTAAYLRLEPGELSFDKDKLQAKGTLDLAKTRYLDGGKMAPLLGLLGATISNQPNIWFGPVDFSLNAGTLTLGRLDFLLADAIHLCLWGNIFLPTQELYLKAGIPADTLAHSFGIRSVRPSYVLKVDVGGTIEHPQVDKGAITGKIAALAALNQIPPKGILGGVASIIARPPDDKDVPSAKYPLPWQR